MLTLTLNPFLTMLILRKFYLAFSRLWEKNRLQFEVLLIIHSLGMAAILYYITALFLLFSHLVYKFPSASIVFSNFFCSRDPLIDISYCNTYI